MADLCLSCDLDEYECVELGGCCDRCDHRPADPGLPDDVALPGLEHDEPRRWSKTARGYLAHLARIEYPDGWTFWSVCLPIPAFTAARGEHSADEVETCFLVRGDRIRRALVVIATGEILAHHDENEARE